jgi:hypothetical protein
VLTKDNLARRNWNGDKLCMFCSNCESIQHIFFYCHFARFMWRVVQVTFNIDTPMCVAHLFNSWAAGSGVQFKKLALVGAVALCRALWTSGMTWCLIILR